MVSTLVAPRHLRARLGQAIGVLEALDGTLAHVEHLGDTLSTTRRRATSILKVLLLASLVAGLVAVVVTVVRRDSPASTPEDVTEAS